MERRGRFPRRREKLEGGNRTDKLFVITLIFLFVYLLCVLIFYAAFSLDLTPSQRGLVMLLSIAYSLMLLFIFLISIEKEKEKAEEGWKWGYSFLWSLHSGVWERSPTTISAPSDIITWIFFSRFQHQFASHRTLRVPISASSWKFLGLLLAWTQCFYVEIQHITLNWDIGGGQIEDGVERMKYMYSTVPGRTVYHIFIDRPSIIGLALSWGGGMSLL